MRYVPEEEFFEEEEDWDELEFEEEWEDEFPE